MKSTEKWERLGLGLVLGLIPPVVGLLAFWWSSVPFLPDRLILLAAGLGFGVGLMVDSRYLKSWVARAYDFNLKIWLGIYGFYIVVGGAALLALQWWLTATMIRLTDRWGG